MELYLSPASDHSLSSPFGLYRATGEVRYGTAGNTENGYSNRRYICGATLYIKALVRTQGYLNGLETRRVTSASRRPVNPRRWRSNTLYRSLRGQRS